MHQEYLLVTAQISGALLGFVGVVLILGRRAEGELSRRDESGLFHLVYSATGALFFSLLMFATLASLQRHEIIWRIGLALIVLYMLFGVSKAIFEGQGGKNRLEPMARHLLSAATVVVIALDVAAAAGFFAGLAPFAYVLSVTLMIGVSVSYFVPLVFIRANN